MQPGKLEVGDIVQLDPAGCGGEQHFGACLMIVTDPKPWGAQGYVKNAGSGGQAYYRVPWEDMEPTGGRAVWMVGEDA